MKYLALLLALGVVFNLVSALPADVNTEGDSFRHLRALENYVRSHQLTSDGNASTAVTLNKRGLGEDPKLQLSFGGEKQHMGNYNEEEIFQLVHESLQDFCDVSWCGGGSNDNCCRDYSPRDRNYKHGTLYKDGKGNKATNAYVRVQMVIGKVNTDQELRDLMYMTVAEAFKREIGANCYQQKWKDGSETTFCNVNAGVDLIVGPFDLCAKIIFNGATSYGEAKCENYKDGAYKGFDLYKDHYFKINNGVAFPTKLVCCDEKGVNCHDM